MADVQVGSGIYVPEQEPSIDASAATQPVCGIQASEATVVMAAYDSRRWPFIVDAVQSVLSGPDQPRRMVICVDRNEEMLERISATWPQVTAVMNTRGRGASGTRNTGAEYADTPFIAFLDDDVRVHENWLARLLDPFTDPAVVGTGGSVVAGWESGRPSWFPEEFDWVVGASYRVMPTVQSAVRNVWSENMAARTEVFRAVGGFRSDFGKVGARSSPEDTDLCIRMAGSAAGTGWVFARNAVVEHHVPAGRARFSYFLRRNYLEGRGKMEMARLLGRQEKLQDEREYLYHTLPFAIRADLKTTIRHGDVNGLLKAGAIITGILAAGVGAVLGMLPSSGKSKDNK
jgi:GT2 family glycosyltransferase